MNNQIQVVSGFKCLLCESIYSTEKHAVGCIKKCEKRIEKENEALEIEKKKCEFLEQIKEREMVLCREVTDRDSLEQLFKKYAKEYLGIEMNFSINNWKFVEKLSNAHICPINGVKNWEQKDDKPKSYPGFKFSFSADLIGPAPHSKFQFARMFSSKDSSKHTFVKAFPNKPKFDNGSSSFESGLIHHFAGINGEARTTSPWEAKEKIRAVGDASIFIDDFPKIKEQFDKFEALKSKKKFYDDALKHLMDDHRAFVNKAIEDDLEMIAAKQLRNQLQEELAQANRNIDSRTAYIISEYGPLKNEMIKTVDESADLDFNKDKQKEFEILLRTFNR